MRIIKRCLKKVVASRALCAVVFCCGAILMQKTNAKDAPLPSRADTASLTSDNIVIVLDASGSMSGTMSGTATRKMDAAKSALTAALEQIPESTKIGLLVFSSANTKEQWLYPLGKLDRVALLAAIQQPQPGGGTPLGEYIKKAADRLISQRQKQYNYGSYRLLVVTDGEASDSELVDRYVPEAIKRGLRIDAIGVDMAATHTLAKKVHSYRKANDPQSLKQAVADVFAEVGGSGDSDPAGPSAFNEIAALPDQTASALLNALSEPVNTPLGETSQPQGGHSQTQHGTGASAIKQPTDTGRNVAYVVGAIICLAIIRGLRRRKSGR